MKRISAFLITMLYLTQMFAQSEFKTYTNGLIYGESTMSKLARIVDSLNLQYKVCELDRTYYSKKQTIGHIVRLDTLNIKQARKDIENNISFNDFISKYPFAKIEKNVLVVKYRYTDYDDKEIVQFGKVSLNSGGDFEIEKENRNDLYNRSVTNSWVFEYNSNSEYSNEELNAFYFEEDFKSRPLNHKYSRQVGYTNCLIDTTSGKFKNKTQPGWVDLPDNWQILSFNEKVQLLDEMRSTKVVGNCSQDTRPREHAVNIALLSAETVNWKVFLKSHLDIMNDRFDRMSDGSYAWHKRETYIRELEELNINIVDLLVGISLRIENPVKNHYYGTIWRIGRAIAESKYKSDFADTILSMIEDQDLDDYNRVISYYLFLRYNDYVDDQRENKANIERLKLSVSKFPEYLKGKVNLID